MKKATRYSYRLAVIVITATVLLAVPHLPDSFVLFLQNTTGALVVSASHLIGLTAHYDPVTQLFDVAGFDMLLGPECVALHYWAILTLSILFFPEQSCTRRIIGWFVTSLGLVFFNIVRLIVLGLVGVYAPEYFAAVHDYIWQVAFALLTVLLCFSWVESSRNDKFSPLKIVMGGFLFSGAIAMLLEAFKHSYLSALAWISDKGLVLLYAQLPWDTRKWTAMNKSFVLLRMKNDLHEFILPGEQYTVNVWLDALGLALFLGGCCSLLVWVVRRKPSSLLMLRFGVTTVTGSLLLLLMQVFSLILLGQLLSYDQGYDLARNYLWLMRSLSVLAPLLLWWWVWNGLKKQAVGQPLISLQS